MIYTFGCSTANWIWPTWSDWLNVYSSPVTKLAFKGFSNHNIFLDILDRIKTFKSEDKVVIMWTQNHRINLWYDREWIDEKDCLGFFPSTNGQLWYTQDIPYLGMYRTHPDYQTSFTNMLVNQFMIIHQTQLLLNKYGIDHNMIFAINPWTDCRPAFKPSYIVDWNRTHGLSKEEVKKAQEVMAIPQVINLLEEIDWTKFVDAPNDILDPNDYPGFCNYYFSKKELIVLKHDTDHHPNTLAHHDFVVEKILGQDPTKSQHRSIAKKIALDAVSMPIPEFTQEDYIGNPLDDILDPQFAKILNKLI